MANVEKFPAGSFCWIELATTDQPAAKKFYASLFGWDVTDEPMGPGEVYTFFKVRDRIVAAGTTLRPEEKQHGVPVHWNLYIAADNADQTAAKTAQAGGKVLMPAFDVPDAGRMAVLQDPTGAAFNIWQSKQVPGLGITGEPGALCWADLSTSDPGRAAKFYAAVFGWKAEKGQNDPSGYLHIKNGEHFIGGIPPAHNDSKTPPHWLIYIQVADVAASAARASDLGAKILMPPQNMEGVGVWAIVADPQGGVFALFKSAR
jgi:predicted enzyme related to lactoylglutathione lyase